MPAPNNQVQIQEMPLKIVGGTHYGRYDKISDEATWNMIISDTALVPYAGYKNVLDISDIDVGRGLYVSYRSNLMYIVIGFDLYSINSSLQLSAPLGALYTNTGDVYMSENNGGEIIITDGQYVYIWNYETSTFWTSNPVSTNHFSFPFDSPGYVSFQNGRFIVASQGTTNWVLSAFNNGGSRGGTPWPVTANFVGSLQTKPDYIQAAVPVPGGGNNLLVFGRNVAELWQDVGAATFPYQRNSTLNSDFGCISPASIASLNDVIVWIAVNETTGPMLMTYERSQINQITTDGIDFKLGNLKFPQIVTGFLYQQDGHLLYQFTFKRDNLSFAYDFNTKEFFCISDPELNFHIARQVVYFGTTYYFVSLTDGSLYQFDTIFPYADKGNGNLVPIPRIRIMPPLRIPSQRYFIINNLAFTLEQGQPNIVTDVVVYDTTGTFITTEGGFLITTEDSVQITTENDNSSTALASYQDSDAIVYLAISRDGGSTFGNFLPQSMNPTGKRKSRLNYQRLGIANDATFQIRCVGLIRFVLFDGVVVLYQ